MESGLNVTQADLLEAAESGRRLNMLDALAAGS